MLAYMLFTYYVINTFKTPTKNACENIFFAPTNIYIYIFENLCPMHNFNKSSLCPEDIVLVYLYI